MNKTVPYGLIDHKNQMWVGSYCKRDNEFKTSRMTFNLNTCEAFSYSWWQFVARSGDTIFFNNASYSMETNKHQTIAKNILFLEQPEKYGIKVKYVYYKEGLNHLPSAINNMETEIQVLEELIQKPRTHKKTNEIRKKRITDLKNRIIETRELMKELNL